MEGLEVHIDDQCLLATDEYLVGDSSIDPRGEGDFLRFGDWVFREKREGASTTVHTINTDVGVVLIEIATQGLRDDTCPRILIEHRLLQADDVSTTALDVLQDRIGLGLTVGLEAEGADIVREHAYCIVFVAEDLCRAADGEVDEKLWQGDEPHDSDEDEALLVECDEPEEAHEELRQEKPREQ